jgi:hypothetical protein
MVLSKSYLIGSIFGFASGFLYFWASFYAFIAQSNYSYLISLTGQSWEDVNFNLELFTIRFIITLIWGAMSIIGALLSILGKRFGNIFCFIAGIGGLIGYAVPIGFIHMPFTDIPISFSETLFFIDIALGIIAGIILTRSRMFEP